MHLQASYYSNSSWGCLLWQTSVNWSTNASPIPFESEKRFFTNGDNRMTLACSPEKSHWETPTNLGWSSRAHWNFRSWPSTIHELGKVHFFDYLQKLTVSWRISKLHLKSTYCKNKLLFFFFKSNLLWSNTLKSIFSLDDRSSQPYQKRPLNCPSLEPKYYSSDWTDWNVFWGFFSLCICTLSKHLHVQQQKNSTEIWRLFFLWHLYFTSHTWGTKGHTLALCMLQRLHLWRTAAWLLHYNFPENWWRHGKFTHTNLFAKRVTVSFFFWVGEGGSQYSIGYGNHNAFKLVLYFTPSAFRAA